MDKSKRDTCMLLLTNAHQLELLLGPEAFVVWLWALTVLFSNSPALSSHKKLICFWVSIQSPLPTLSRLFWGEVGFQRTSCKIAVALGVCASKRLIRSIPSYTCCLHREHFLPYNSATPVSFLSLQMCLLPLRFPVFSASISCLVSFIHCCHGWASRLTYNMSSTN